ncbi:MAG: FAD-dependent oxidoreductase [Dehalococcoidia bacterium]
MDEHVDLLIVGAGTAGMPLAIEAADHAAGGTVVLLDKRPSIGGMLHISGGQFSGAGARRQRERAIDDSPEAHAAEVDRIAHGRATPELVDLAVREAGPMIDWLDDLGFDFLPDTPTLVYGHEVYQTPRTYWGPDWGRSLLKVLVPEVERRVAAGAIDLRLSTRLVDLEVDENGVSGAILQPLDPQGNPASLPYRVATRRVVLATGGFGAAPDLINRFLPESEQGGLAACLEHATGDGLRIAEAHGAGISGYRGYLPTVSLIPDPDRPGFAFDWPIARMMFQVQRRLPYEIWLNRSGQRFVAEDTASPELRERAVLAQPDRWLAVIWDQRILDRADPIIDSDAGDWTRERIAEEAKRGRFVFRADTLDELAGQLGIDPAATRASVDRYNQAVATGRDNDFGRRALPLPIDQPPYYGMTSMAGIILTREGLTVDTDLRVLDVEGRHIPGLYAVGEVLGAAQFMGDSFASGMSVGPCLSLGRRLGKTLGGSIAAEAVVTTGRTE